MIITNKDEINAKIKQIDIRLILSELQYETLEMIFIESKKELDHRFMRGRTK